MKSWLPRAGIALAALAIIVMIVISSMPERTLEGIEGSPTSIPVVVTKRKVVAEGLVVPIKSAALSFSTTGVISQVLAEEGDFVEEGEVIALLSGNEDQAAAVADAELNLLTAKHELEKLHDDAYLARAEAQLALAEAQKEYDTATRKRHSQNYIRGSEDSIKNAEAALVIAEEKLSEGQGMYGYVEGLSPDDPTRANALLSINQLIRDRDTAAANLAYLKGKPGEFEVAEADGKLALAEAEMNAALQRFENLVDGPNPAEVALLEAKIASYEAQLAAAKAAYADLELLAPFSGEIVSSDLKVGEVVNLDSQPVFFADMSTWQVTTTDLTELNVVDIEEDMLVLVTFDALPDLELAGKVVAIQGLGEIVQGDVTYEVLVELTEQDEKLRWNMTAYVTFFRQ
jgi:HlyD family secretion protein